MTFLLLKASSAFVLSRMKVFLPTVIVIVSMEERGRERAYLEAKDGR
jgi:hypothetical protein